MADQLLVKIFVSNFGHISIYEKKSIFSKQILEKIFKSFDKINSIDFHLDHLFINKSELRFDGRAVKGARRRL